MKIESSVKNKVTKTQCNELFDIIVKDKLKNFNFNLITNFSCLPVAFVYDKKLEKPVFYIGKHVTPDVLKVATIQPKFFEEIIKDMLMTKGRNSTATLDELNDIFNKVILKATQQVIPKQLFHKKFSFKNENRYLLFKGCYELGTKYPRRSLSQDQIVNYIQQTYPEGYQQLLTYYETPEYVRRQVGYIVTDLLRTGIQGFTQLGSGEYMFDFSELNIKIDETNRKVYMTSEKEFVKITGTFWSQNTDRSRARTETLRTQKAPTVSNTNHALAPLFNELNIDLKYLPRNKKDTKVIINYMARNKTRKESQQVMSAINDWDGK